MIHLYSAALVVVQLLTLSSPDKKNDSIINLLDHVKTAHVTFSFPPSSRGHADDDFSHCDIVNERFASRLLLTVKTLTMEVVDQETV